MICLTNSQAKYLKACYELSLKGDIRISLLAQHLNCSKPSVVRGIKKLQEKDLVIYGSKIKLTEKGELIAQKIVVNDQILFDFFVDVLKISASQAKREIEQLKCAVSCQTILKLEKYLAKVLNKKNSFHYDVCQDFNCKTCK